MKELDLILKNIKNKQLLPVYFFHGEEPFFIDTAVKSFENDLLSEDEKSFGLTVLYGKETSLAEVLSFSQQLPMFGDLNVIIVKEAQDLKFTEDEIKKFLNYLANPVTSTVLVFAHKYKKADTKLKWVKELTAKKQIFYSEKIREYQVASWISGEAKKLHLKISPEVAQLLADHLGSDLSRIYNELNKVKIILKDGEVLDAKMVEKHIGISKEFNVFELLKAVGQKNPEKSLFIAHFMGKERGALPKSLPSLFNYFCNLILLHTHGNDSDIVSQMGINPYFLTDYKVAARNYPLKAVTKIISLIRDTDLKSKGLGVNQLPDDELFTELIYKIVYSDFIK